jgi:hypothetical protein
MIIDMNSVKACAFKSGVFLQKPDLIEFLYLLNGNVFLNIYRLIKIRPDEKRDGIRCDGKLIDFGYEFIIFCFVDTEYDAMASLSTSDMNSSYFALLIM